MNRLVVLLRRSTHSTSFIPEIDGLRFYAIMTVVVYHLNTAFARQLNLADLGSSLLGGRNSLLHAGWWIIRLDLGVKVFFAISGFVLALPFLRYYLLGGKPIKINAYFYRRLTRLEPPFILSLVLFLCVHVFVLKESLATLLPHFSAGIIYGHVFIFGAPNPINPVTWSLETEAQFYLLVPFFFALLFLIRKNWYAALVIVGAFSCSVFLRGYFINHGISQLSTSVLAFGSNFLVGIVCAWIYLSFPSFIKKKGLYWDLLGLCFVFGQFFWYKPQDYWLNNVLFNLCILGMILAVFKGILLNWFFSQPLVYVIGGMCYSIYLLHYAFFHLLIKFTAHLQIGLGYGTDLFVQMLVCIPIVLMLSSLFFLLIEKPCMDKNWPQRLSNWFKKKLSIG